MSHRLSAFSLTSAALIGALLVTARPARAADPVPLEQAEADVTLLLAQLKNDKGGNDDPNGSIAAVLAEFFNIAPPAGEAPTAPAAGAPEEEQKAFVAAQKKYEDDHKAWQAKVKEWQGKAVDALFKALRVVVYNPKNKENTRADVNLKAAQALGDILGSADLAKLRDAKEVEKLRADRARDLEDVITNDFGKPKGNKEFTVRTDILEATFAALGRTNEPKALDWLSKEYIHTRNGQFEEDRLVAAHKAMKLFTNVPGKTRFAIVGQMITQYSGTEANAKQTGGTDPKARTQAQAAKAFWDKIKAGVVDCINYYATAPGGGPPANAEGQGYTTVDDLKKWWTDHDKASRAPWVDPPKEAAPTKDAAPSKDAPK